jgi:hypothetical protein
VLELGKVVMTKGICKRCKDSPTFSFLVQKALSMHAEGNWGDLSDEDWEVNQQALKDGIQFFLPIGWTTKTKKRFGLSRKGIEV